MKKTLKLIPAIAMLLISTIMLSTATFAWFSMNTQVTAKGMQVKAAAEGGIVISNVSSGGDWKAEATASNASAELIPTSTKNLAVWYHAKSDDANSAKENQDSANYTTITKTGEGANLVDSTGIGVWTDAASAAHNIYLLNSFFIKSSAEQMTGATLYINSVSVAGSSGSVDLDKSLRVAITLGGVTHIFAPVTGADTTYNAGGTASSTTTGSVTCIAPGTKNTTVGTNVTIPAYTAEALEAVVYIYFEGEDENCKSANLTASLDTLTVTIQFGTTTIS